MKVVSLNIWAGRNYDSLMEYIASCDADVFCFQEVYDCAEEVLIEGHFRSNIYIKLQEALPGYTAYFAPQQDHFGFSKLFELDATWGIAMFIKKGISADVKSVFINRFRNAMEEDAKTLGHVMQYALIDGYVIAHLHGLWNGAGKTDTPQRLEQSRKIKESLPAGKIVLSGDFNLLPDTESVRILEENLVNLIKKHNITSTRNKFYKFDADQYADYTFVSPDVVVKKFSVPYNEASDHLPLEIEFE